jgi:hypothetical protein
MDVTYISEGRIRKQSSCDLGTDLSVYNYKTVEIGLCD